MAVRLRYQSKHEQLCKCINASKHACAVQEVGFQLARRWLMAASLGPKGSAESMSYSPVGLMHSIFQRLQAGIRCIHAVDSHGENWYQEHLRACHSFIAGVVIHHQLVVVPLVLVMASKRQCCRQTQHVAQLQSQPTSF
jgi:hypothetical protein